MLSPVSVNLVKGRKPHFFEKFTNWALTAGRIVVILTEMVALGAFLYRFGLDRQLVDLHDKIVQEQNIVKFLKKNEDIYRNFQDRTTLASHIMSSQGKIMSVYQGIIAILPKSMTVKNITFSPGNMHLEASIQSVSELTTFINNLKNQPQVSNVSLDKIENRATIAITDVSISITFKDFTTKLL